MTLIRLWSLGSSEFLFGFYQFLRFGFGDWDQIIFKVGQA